MKPWIKTALVAALSTSVVFGGVAMAHEGEEWCDHGKDKAGHAVNLEQVKSRVSSQVELRLAKLELALALKPEQKQAWADFKQSITTGSETALKEIESSHLVEPPKTAAERLEREVAASKLRINLLADAQAAIGAIYGKLNDTQKTVFDAEAVKLLHLAHVAPTYAGHGGQPRHAGKGARHGHGQTKAKADANAPAKVKGD
jgi:hypothetical protein